MLVVVLAYKLVTSVSRVVIDDERLEIPALISLISNVVDAWLADTISVNVDKLNSRSSSEVLNPATKSFKEALEESISITSLVIRSIKTAFWLAEAAIELIEFVLSEIKDFN